MPSNYVLYIGLLFAIALSIGLAQGMRSDVSSFARRRFFLALSSVTGASIAYLASSSGLFAALPIDPTPFLFLGVGLVLCAALFCPRSGTLLPQAHNAAFDTVSASIIVLDPEHRVAKVNATAQSLVAHMSNRSPSEPMVGQPIQQLLPTWTGLMPYLHGTEKEHNTSLQVVHERTRRSFDLRITPLRNDNGRFLGRLLTIHETTEQESAAEALRQRKLQLRSMVHQMHELSQRREHTIAQLSDELSTPLTNIRFYTNLIEREQVAGQRTYLEQLHRELTNLQELLSIRRDSEQPTPENAAAPQATRPLKLNDVIFTATRSLLEQAQLAEVELKIDAPDLVHTVGNYQQLVRVTSNLIEHVISHTPRGGCVSIQLYREETCAFLQVQDTAYALGRPAGAQESVALTRTVPAEGLYARHGTDLKQARKILDMHGGQIDVEHPHVGGHRFTVRLPQVDMAHLSQAQNGYRLASLGSVS